MSHLTEAQIAEFGDELERQLAKLEKSMTVTDEALKTVELDQGAVGRLSRMDSLQKPKSRKRVAGTGKCQAGPDPGSAAAAGGGHVWRSHRVRQPRGGRAPVRVPGVGDMCALR